jgi:hypothetical protein
MRIRRGWLGVAAGALLGCSLVTDLASLGGDAGSEAGPSGSCSGPGLACVPSAPSGWGGPFWIYYGDPANRPASCPAATPGVAIAGNDTLLDASVACSSRVCSPHCSNPFAFPFGCSGPGSLTASAVDAGCWAVQDQLKPDAAWSMQLQNPFTQGCAFTSDVLDAGGLAWKAAMIGCEPDASPQLDCPAAEQCLATAPIPFEGKPCIYKRGVNVCPGAPYSQMRSSTLFETAVPSCDVSGCGCSTGGGQCTLAVDYVGPSAACGPSNVSLGANQCASSPGPGYVHATTSPPTNATCTLPDGSPPCSITGVMTPESPFTVCCEP